MTWDLTKPADSRDANLGPADIRELKTDLQTALQVEHTFPGSDVADPKAYHKIPYGNTASRPAAGNSGRWYYNTTTNSVQRDTGTAWSDMTPPKGLVPSGTKTIFGQAAAPTGWTKDVSNNDKVLRVVSGTGAGSGGTWTITLDSMSHTHVVNQNNSLDGSHMVSKEKGTNWANTEIMMYKDPISNHNFTHDHTFGSAHAHGHTSDGSWRPAYLDVIVCTKD